MPTAYKLPGAGTILTEYLQLQAETEHYKLRISESVSRRFEGKVRAEFVTDPSSRGITGVVLRTDDSEDLPEGWIYQKTAKAVIPDPKSGDHSRGFFDRLQPPARQEGAVIDATGLPAAFFQYGTALVPQWLGFDDTIWVLVPSITDTPVPEGPWEEASIADYSEAVEDHLRRGGAIVRGR